MVRTRLDFCRALALRTKVLSVLLIMLLVVAVYRIAFYVPAPGVDQDRLAQHLSGLAGAG